MTGGIILQIESEKVIQTAPLGFSGCHSWIGIDSPLEVEVLSKIQSFSASSSIMIVGKQLFSYPPPPVMAL